MTQLTVTLKNKSKAKMIAKTIKELEGVVDVVLEENEDDNGLDPEELRIVNERYEEYLKDKSQVTTWKEIRKEISNKYGI